MKERRLSTSWTLTYFWVLLSLILATLSTFSFVQVDWLVKRETLIVTHYLPSANRSSTATQVGRRTTSNHMQMNRNHFPQTWVQFPSTLNYINNDEQRLNMTVIKIVKKTVTSFSWGVFGMCNYEGSNPTSSLLHCGLHKEEDIPRYTLIVVLSLLGGLGCLTLGASAAMSLMAVALPTSKLRHEVARTIGHAQAVSVVLLFLLVVGFPLEFGSETVRKHCGRGAGPFNLDECEIGWAYALFIVCSALALYCPVLVQFTIVLKPHCLPKYL